MANYTYRISASGTATGADAGFTTINAAVADFVGNNRMGAGTGIVAASSTLYFKIDGFLAIEASVSGIDTTTNSGAAIVVEHWADAWNATAGRIGYQTSFDGLDLGGFNQAFFGTWSSRQANLTVRNLVFRWSVGGYTSGVAAAGPMTGAVSVLLENLFMCCNQGSQAAGPTLDAANMRNCVVFFPNGGGDGVVSVGRASANAIENCTFVALAAMGRWFVYNQNDPLPLVKNSYIGLGTSSFVNSGTWSTSCTGNATDQASGATNWTSTVTSVAVSTTNFENVTSGTEDFRVKFGSALATTGATRLASTLADVFAVSRQDPTTIGAHEALTGGGGGSATGAAAHYYRQMQ